MRALLSPSGRWLILRGGLVVVDVNVPLMLLPVVGRSIEVRSEIRDMVQ